MPCDSESVRDSQDSENVRYTPAWQKGWDDCNRDREYKPGRMDKDLYLLGWTSCESAAGISPLHSRVPKVAYSPATPAKAGEGEATVDLKGEVRTISETGGEKGVKPQRYSLIPVEPLALLAELYGNGAKKYAAHNFRNGYEWSKSYDAAMRHMNAFWAGEDIDPEMGVPHVICAAWHMFTLTTFMIEHPEHDDRYKAEIGTLFENAQKAMAEYKGEQLPPFPTEPSVGPYYPN